MSSWFSQIITTEDQESVEVAKREIEHSQVLLLLVALHIEQFLRARLHEREDGI